MHVCMRTVANLELSLRPVGRFDDWTFVCDSWTFVLL